MKSLNKQTPPKVNWLKIHGEYVDGIYEGLLHQLESQFNAVKMNLQAQSDLFIKGNDFTINSIDLAREEAGIPDFEWTFETLLDYSDARRFSAVSENIELFIELIDEIVWDDHRDLLVHLLDEAKKFHETNYLAPAGANSKNGGCSDKNNHDL